MSERLSNWGMSVVILTAFMLVGCGPEGASFDPVQYESDEAGDFGDEFAIKLGTLNLWSSDSCCQPSPTDAASCNLSSCVSCVKTYDPYCESGEWDELCVYRAADANFCLDSCHCSRLCIQGSNGAWLPGDLNGTDAWSNVLDAQCQILMALWEAQGGNSSTMPACMAQPWYMGDLNCNGNINVGDVLVLINTALKIDLSAAVDADGDWCPDACDYPGPNPCEVGETECDDANRCSNTDTCVAPSCDGLNNQETVSLEYIVKSGNAYQVGFSKSFGTCAHLLDMQGNLLHTNNFFCSTGSCKEATIAVGDLQIASGDRVKLCNGNNYGNCSNYVVVSDGPNVCRGTENNCDDSNWCTSDYCDPHGETTGYGGCYQVDISNTCPDQYYCTDDGCDVNRAPGHTYTSSSTGCFSDKNNSKCEDNNYCSQNTCTANSGSDGNGCAFPDESWRCNDQLPCTNDWCSANQGSGWSGITTNSGSKPSTSVSDLWPQGCNNVYKCSSVPNGADSCNNTASSNPWSLAGSSNPQTSVSAGTCYISGCNQGFFDFDGNYANGCECKQDTFDFDNGTGNSCGAARNLGEFKDNDQKVVQVEGNLLSSTNGSDEDWYVFTATDVADSSCDNFHVRARFVSNPAGYKLDVRKGGCSASGANFCPATDDYEWATDFKTSSGGTVTGQCPCTNDSPTTNMCTNDSDTFYVRVYRPSGVQINCTGYKLEVSNGFF